MKADTALITINQECVLKVLLVPETDDELEFLQRALKEAVTYRVSFEGSIRKEK